MTRLTVILALIILAILAVRFFFLAPGTSQPRTSNDFSAPSSGQNYETVKSPVYGPVTPPSPPPPSTSPTHPISFFTHSDPKESPSYQEAKAGNLALIAEGEKVIAAGPEAIRSCPVAQWREKIEKIHWEMDWAGRRRWAEALRNAWAPDRNAWRKLGHQGASDLGILLDKLDKRQSGLFLAAWWGDQETWRSASPSTLSVLALQAAELDQTSVMDGQKIIPQETMARVEAACKSHPSLDADAMENLARAWLALDRPVEAGTWAEGACQAALAKPEALMMDTAYRLGRLAAETGKGGTSVAWADALGKMAQAGRLDPLRSQARTLGWTVRSSEGRKALESLLVDSSGHLRLGAGKVWAYAHYQNQEMPALLKRLGEMAEGAVEGDRMAWDLLKEYAQSVAALERSGEQPRWMAALMKANVRAKTPAEAFLILKERLSLLREGSNFEQMGKLMEEARGRFEGDWLAKVEELGKGIERDAASYALMMARQKARSEENRRLARSAYLRSCEEGGAGNP